MKSINYEKWEPKISFLFKVLFLLYMFSQAIVIFHRTAIVKGFLWCMLLTGVVVCLLRLYKIRDYIKVKGIIWLVMFVFSYLISIICNRNYGVGADFANLIILSLAIFAVYLPEISENKKQIKKELEIISQIFLGLMNVSIVISLIMLIIGYGEMWDRGDYMLKVGIVENRLWGVFTGPNLAAIYAVVSMGLCFYFWRVARKKIYYIITIGLDVLYLIFADSRTGTVCLFVLIAFVSFMLLVRMDNLLKIKNVIVRSGTCVVVSLLLASFVAMVPTQLQKVYNYAIINIGEELGDDEDAKVIKREYDLSGDISNKRWTIWESGLEIFESKPITGVGFHHLKTYAKKELPNTYMATNTSNLGHMHNEILNILVSQGILGIIPFILFTITSVVSIFRKYLKTGGREYKEYTFLIGCLATICVGIMLNEGVLYHYTPNATMFWVILSYLRYTEIE